MRISFTFDTEKNQSEYDIFKQSYEMLRMLDDLRDYLRNKQKYGHSFKDADDTLDQIREEFYRLLNDNNINLDI
jgi:septation ring formation regulator EzrA